MKILKSIRLFVVLSLMATLSDALAGVTRLRLVVEAATCDNISQRLTAIAELKL